MAYKIQPFLLNSSRSSSINRLSLEVVKCALITLEGTNTVAKLFDPESPRVPMNLWEDGDTCKASLGRLQWIF